MSNIETIKSQKNAVPAGQRELPCYAFGQRVSFSHRLIRVCASGNMKIWEKVPWSCSNAIFLGTRILKNGKREWDSEYGWSFTPKEYFKAALICPTDKINPVFVPFDCIEA